MDVPVGRAAAAIAAALAVAAWAGRARPPRQRRVPAALKAGYAGFVTLLVPVYWRAYGPSNFLWLSDLGLFATTAAAIGESPLPASMAAVGVLPLELAWNVDFLAGGRLLGLTGYMFERDKKLTLRAFSLFHIALPPTLLWLLHRLGYDRRAFALQILLTSLLLPLTYVATPRDANINWVFGPGAKPQDRVPPRAYLALEMAAIPLLAMLPAHALLKRIFDVPPARRRLRDA